MSTRIIAITQPLIDLEGNIVENPIGHPTLTVDEFIAYVARISNPSNQGNTLTAKKLIKYLIKNKHWSPFQLVHAVAEINTTRDIGRQILRHSSFSFQEFSQRYADPTKDLGFVTREARLQDTTNRQASVKIADDYTITDPNTFAPLSLKNVWQSEQEKLTNNARRVYKWAIDNGIAKEQARAVLPEGLTTTKMYMAGSLRSWVTYCSLRGYGHSVDPVTGEKKKSTQAEHVDIAREIWTDLSVYFPSLADIDMESI